jgi:hypothetical protein
MKLDKLFSFEYPKTLVYAAQVKDKKGINFVSSSGKNNGIAGRVKINPQIKLYPKGLITVPLKGSVLSAFVQPEQFYVAHQIAVLTPKKKMSISKKLFYCMCIRANRYKYNYGRQADRTLKEMKVPNKVPAWVDSSKLPKYGDISESLNKSNLKLNDRRWAWFRYDDLFTIKKGERIVNSQMKKGKIPCIRPIASNNGVYKFIDIKPNHEGNTITVSYNGSVGEAFYQPKPHFSLDDINVLYPNFSMNVYSAMFLITLIIRDKYRFGYGRKWDIERMNKSTIQLPVNESGKPDWDFMENYVKSLRFSKELSKLNS